MYKETYVDAIKFQVTASTNLKSVVLRKSRLSGTLSVKTYKEAIFESLKKLLYQVF